MISLTAANVSLKPSQKKQLLARLKRSVRLGERIGNFLLKISIRRTGRHVEVIADGRDNLGDFHCRTKQITLSDAIRLMVRMIAQRVHLHTVGHAKLRLA